MAIPQSDILILNCIKQGIYNLRKEPFYIDYIFEYDELPNVEKNYGRKETERAKKWFVENHIDVGFEWAFDQARYPSITISNSSSVEDKNHAVLGDEDMPSDEYINEQNIITRPRYIAGPFEVSYDLATGIVTLPNTFVEYPLIFKGQSLVSAKSNTAYSIEEILSDNQFRIEKNLHVDFTESYIRPQFNKLKVIRRIVHFLQKFEITARTNGDPATIIWLHDILLYILLKNRSLLFHDTFGLPNLASSETMLANDEAHGGNLIYSKTIYLEALVQSRWVQEFSQQYEGVVEGINILKNSDPTKTIYAKINKT